MKKWMTIVELCEDVPCIELFARERYEGWGCLGDAIDRKDIREAILEGIEQAAS